MRVVELVGGIPAWIRWLDGLSPGEVLVSWKKSLWERLQIKEGIPFG